MSDKVSGPLAKIERAEEQIYKLESAWANFREHAYQVASKDDPQTEDRTYYLSSVRDIPPTMSLLAGDAVHNLRTALDHLIQLLISVKEGAPGPFKHVYFPIATDAAEYKSARRRVVKRIRQEAIEAIDRIEPYGGGKGEML